MSVLQSRLEEIRYMQRQNLEEEAKIVGNYYRDILRQYGVNCNYYKLKIPYMDHFKKIVDENTLILHAYGQDNNPDYSISSDMITYMEVENDIMNLNKYGIIPDMNVNFYFDTNDFACQLAYKLGQLKEYPIEEQEFITEVPPIVYDEITIDYDNSDVIGDDIIEELGNKRFFKHGIGYRIPEYYKSSILSGKFCVNIGPYNLSDTYTVMCHPYEHGDVNVNFPVNDSIYKSFQHVIGTKEYVDQMLFLKYNVMSVAIDNNIRYILKGKLYGSILFHDLCCVGKYLDKIHPDVGDIVTIDFPDENNRQQFEITECNDKNLGNDGINPLLHRYVWKCKARRYVNSGEDFPEKNEANERWKEKVDILNDVDEKIAKEISNYDDEHSDGIYGGYERPEEVYDKEVENVRDLDKNKFIDGDFEKGSFEDDGSFITIFRFHDNSRLMTDGYELYFVNKENFYFQLTMVEDNRVINENLVQSGLQYIKSTDDALFFVNFEGKSQKICEDESVTQGELQICLNSLVDATYDRQNNNNDGDFYYKFRESNTVLMSIDGFLYCRFGNKNRKMVKLNFKRKCD